MNLSNIQKDINRIENEIKCGRKMSTEKITRGQQFTSKQSTSRDEKFGTQIESRGIIKAIFDKKTRR